MAVTGKAATTRKKPKKRRGPAPGTGADPVGVDLRGSWRGVKKKGTPAATSSLDRKRPSTKLICDPAEAIMLLPDYDPHRDADLIGATFDPKTAVAAVSFFHNRLTHVAGSEHYGKPLILGPWQQGIVMNLFGWKMPDGTRRFRTAFILVPRKNGKSTLMAGLVLYVGDQEKDEHGAQLYSCAADAKQAGLIFEDASMMVANDRELRQAVKSYVALKCLEWPIRDAEGFVVDRRIYRALSSDAKTKHGFNTHFCAYDELHAAPNAKLYDVMQTSMGSRKQPLMLVITTADFQRKSICNEKHDYAHDVISGNIRDARFLPALWELKQGEDFNDPKVQARVNPNLGVSVEPTFIEEQVQQAKRLPRFLNTVLRLHFCKRTESSSLWIPKELWDACEQDYDQKALAGCNATAGLDLSSTRDLTALGLWFPKEQRSLLWFWAPQYQADLRTERHDPISYQAWSDAGLLTLHPGKTVNHGAVRAFINKLGAIFNITGIGVDRMMAAQIITELGEEDGFNVHPHGQGFLSMNGPCKHLERLLLEESFHHNGHPILDWNRSNTATEEDAARCIKLCKKDVEDNKIDGMVALVMAMGVAIAQPKPKKSVYETRGPIIL